MRASSACTVSKKALPCFFYFSHFILCVDYIFQISFLIYFSFAFTFDWQARDGRPFRVVRLFKHLLGDACWPRLLQSSVSAALVTLSAAATDDDDGGGDILIRISQQFMMMLSVRRWNEIIWYQEASCRCQSKFVIRKRLKQLCAHQITFRNASDSCRILSPVGWTNTNVIKHIRYNREMF